MGRDITQRRIQRLGLFDQQRVRVLAQLQVHQRRALGRLIEQIAGEGTRIDAKTQAPAHLLMYAAMRGLICRGPDVARDEPTYVLLDDWVDDSGRLDREEALAELARRYLAGYGPATVQDFLTWSGLPAVDGKKAFTLISEEIVNVNAAGTVMSALSSTDLDAIGECRPHLLGHFDALLLGYRNRALLLDPAYSKRIQAGGGFIQPAAVVDGRVIGTWRLVRDGKRLKVVIEPFAGLPRGSRDGLHVEAEDIGRFLGGDVTFEIAA